MFRRHPIVTVLGVVYFGGLCFLSLGVRTTAESSFVGDVILLVPAGLILIALFTRRHWFAAFSVGSLAVVWIELACVVWRPDTVMRGADVLAGIVGVTVGILIAVAVASLRDHHRDGVREAPVLSFTRLSQTGSSGLTTESPRD